MRKSYLTLAAVAAIMASCSNEVLIDDIKSGDTDVAIGFSTFSDKATKGDTGVNTNLEYYHSSFAVYGTKKSTVTNTVGSVFDATATAYTPATGDQNGTGEWKYATPRYWDKQANYNFIAVAPSAAIVKYAIKDILYVDGDEIPTGKTVGDVKVAAADREVGEGDFVTVAAGYTLNGQNLQATATTAEIVKGFTGGAGEDTDIMTSAKASQAGSSVTSTTVVNLTFKHILAKLNVTVAKAQALDNAVVKVKSLEITGLDDKGTYSESTYNATTPTSGWSSSVNSASYKLSYSNATGQVLNSGTTNDNVWTAGDPYYFIESLVMPQPVTESVEKLKIVYTITTEDANGGDPHTEEYAYTMDLSSAFTSFMDRNNYTLKLTIEPLIIKFDATATVWADQPAQSVTINK